MEVNFDDTKRLVNTCAKSVADEVTGRSINDDDLWKIIEAKCEDVAYGYVCNGLQILASYGWSDALAGGDGYETSPLYEFENDVHVRVLELLDDEGINVY